MAASKDNLDIFPNFILQNFNQGVIDGKFPDQLNGKTLVLSLKKETISIKSIIDRWVSYPSFQKFMSFSFTTKETKWQKMPDHVLLQFSQKI